MRIPRTRTVDSIIADFFSLSSMAPINAPHRFPHTFFSALLFGCIVAVGCSDSASDKSPEDQIRDVVVGYLASPRHAGSKFNRQILGEISFEIYDIDSNFLYFSMPERLCGNEEGQKAIAHITQSTDSVEWSGEENGVLFFKDIRGRHTEERGCLFRTPVTNIRIDTNVVLHFPFSGADYSPSLRDLADYFTDDRIYGGARKVYRDDGKNRRYTVFVNHGIFVSRPDEPSLKRFAESLTKNIPSTDPQAREKKIQALLDFVTNEIAYDYSEAAQSYEVMKRPCETLMSGRSDCSNKATLFASLLEQMGEDYLLVYSPGHINVAVPKGNFTEINGHSFDWNDTRWVVCETTAEGFQIGTDQLDHEFGFKQVEYVQRPREESIINPHNGQKLAFK